MAKGESIRETDTVGTCIPVNKDFDRTSKTIKNIKFQQQNYIFNAQLQ